MKVLLTGATGFVGSAIAHELLRRGHHVIGLVRDPAKAGKLAALGVHLERGDMLEPDTYRPLVAQADAVIHAAQLGVSGRFNQANKQKINAADALMTTTLADECVRHGKKLVYASGCFNYGNHDEEWIDETTAATPSPLGEGHHAMVQYLLDRHQREGLRVTIITAGFVYGPGGMFKTAFFDQLQKGQLRVIGPGHNYWSPVHVADLAQAFVLAAEQAHDGQSFNAVDDEPIRLRQLVDTLTDAYGAKRVGTIYPWLMGLLLGAPLVKSLTSSFRVRNAKSKRVLGWQPRYATFASGVGPVLQELPATK
jgi:nucleoside-diphosphate-sugar epimerase